LWAQRFKLLNQHALKRDYNSEARMTKEELLKTLEADGPEAVRHKLSRGLYSGARAAWASEWLGTKDEAQQRASDALALGALNQAKTANRVAIVSAAVAALALVVSLVKGG
jgi:hypothetical protein